jgi:hypothetical protein
VLATKEHGRTFVLERRASSGARAGCGCGVIGAVLLCAMLIAMAVLPPRKLTLDCARDRGTCTYAARTLPLDKIKHAEIVRDQRGGRGYRVHTVSFGLLLTSGEHAAICTAPQDDPAAKELGADVARADAFFVAESTKTLRIDCAEDISTTRERIYYPASSLFLLVVALVMLRFVAASRVEFDPERRVVRFKGSFGSKLSKREIPFSELESVSLEGRVLRLVMRDGLPITCGVASNDAEGVTLAGAKARIESMLASA